MKFEEVAEQLMAVLTRLEAAEKDSKKQHKELQSQLRRAAGGARPASEVEDEGSEYTNEVIVEVPLWRRCFKIVTGKEGYWVWYSFLLMLQMVAVFGLFIEAAEDADGATQTVAGLLGASAIMGLVLAIPAMYLKRSFFLNVYLVCQIWTCALAAVVAADAIQDVYKSYSFCMLKGVEGVPDDQCTVRESRARGKVFYALCTALMAITVGCVAQNIKDAVAREEVETMMRGRGGLMSIMAGSATPARTPGRFTPGRTPGRMTSRSVGRIGGGSSQGGTPYGGTPMASPQWKGKTWQSQKAIPSSKMLMAHLGEDNN